MKPRLYHSAPYTLIDSDLLFWDVTESRGEAVTSYMRTLLAELKEHLYALYGNRLKGLYLFGSYARDEADAESDVDVLIVLDRINNYSEEIDRTSDVISELSLKHGMVISRVLATEQRWREDESLFFLNVREEAIPV